MSTPLIGMINIVEALQTLAKSQSSLNERVLYEAADYIAVLEKRVTLAANVFHVYATEHDKKVVELYWAADMEDTSISKQDYLARKAKADRNHNLVKEMLRGLGIEVAEGFNLEALDNGE